jgi:ATP-binding cassette subfamily B multidrug efflux pump
LVLRQTYIFGKWAKLKFLLLTGFMKELKHLNKYFKKYWLKLLVGLIITVIAKIFQLVMPSYVKKSIQVVENFIGGEISKEIAKNMLLECILIIVGAALLSGFFTFLMRQTIIYVSRYIEFDLKNEIFDHYQQLSLNFYKKNRTGDLMNRISEDVTKVRMYFGPAVMYFLNMLVLFIVAIIKMYSIDPTLTLYTVFN